MVQSSLTPPTSSRGVAKIEASTDGSRRLGAVGVELRSLGLHTRPLPCSCLLCFHIESHSRCTLRLPRIPSQESNRLEGLTRRHDRVRIIRQIDIEGGTHHFFRIVCRRVFYNCDLIAEFSGISDSCFHAGVRYES